MAARRSSLDKRGLLQLAEDMALDEDAAGGNRLKAIEFLLEHGEQVDGNVEEVWDELFLVGENA